jgi:FlaA1/EpsC-like NDP-sugar epimerase
MSISVLLVGAGGAFGQPLLEEFIRQKTAFKSIGLLSSTEKKVAKYAWAAKQGVKVVVGSFLQSKSYEGNISHFGTTASLSNK